MRSLAPRTSLKRNVIKFALRITKSLTGAVAGRSTSTISVINHTPKACFINQLQRRVPDLKLRPISCLIWAPNEVRACKYLRRRESLAKLLFVKLSQWRHIVAKAALVFNKSFRNYVFIKLSVALWLRNVSWIFSQTKCMNVRAKEARARYTGYHAASINIQYSS